MTSNIRIKKVCRYCKRDFIAMKTTTKTCSDNCAKRLYKQVQKAIKIEQSRVEARKVRIELIDGKEYLTVKEVSIILDCTPHTVYDHIQKGIIQAKNISKRLTRIKRSTIEKFFNQALDKKPKINCSGKYSISQCYSLIDIQEKYKISEKALYELIKRNNIKRIRKGRFVYLPKTSIDKAFNN